MTVQEMHYDLKTKCNKLDSQQFRNLIIPEIDWKLNEAIGIFIKSIAEPRFAQTIGLEFSQRSIDDLRTIIVDEYNITPTQIGTTSNYEAILPTNYQHLIKSYILADKNTCTGKKLKCIVRKHQEEHEIQPFDESSFEWRECNIHFVGNTIKIFTDGIFVPKNFVMDYIKKHPYVNYSQGFSNTGYLMPDGATLVSINQDCILPQQVHREIVDLAVLIITGEINPNELQIKANKQQLNN